MADLDFPYRFDAHGRTASTGGDDHVRDLIEQLLLTAPGERVMRPEFGSGLLGLVFEPNSTVLAAATQLLVQSSLEQHLGHLLVVDAVEVAADDAVFRVEVRYSRVSDRTSGVVNVVIPGGTP